MISLHRRAECVTPATGEQPSADFLIRDSEPGDLPAIAAIYGHWAINGHASFELSRRVLPK